MRINKKVVSRATDWLNQALRDLKHAEKSVEMGDYEWACFASQQAAEKALKALFQAMGVEVWGHSVLKMVQSLEYGSELLDCAKELDKFYIPTRYPNSYSEGIPAEYFTESDAKRAISCARKVVEFCHKAIQDKLR